MPGRTHPERIVLGDWGTTSCRLHLFEHGRIRDGATGPGLLHTDEPARAYADMVADWEAHHGPLPALLCGTVGANIGWVDASYVSAPARIGDFHARRVRTEREGVAILPGVMTESNAFGQPDVMRGEEMQVFGYLAATGATNATLCLPGSHTKWVTVKDSAITDLTSSATGELFAAIRKATIIAPESADGSGPVRPSPAFRDGVTLAGVHPALPAAIFSIRADAALNRLSLADSRDRLSGLLIGADCGAMLRAVGVPSAIIGSPAVSRLYHDALTQLGHDVPLHDGQDAVLAGLALAAGLQLRTTARR